MSTRSPEVFGCFQPQLVTRSCESCGMAGSHQRQMLMGHQTGSSASAITTIFRTCPRERVIKLKAGTLEDVRRFCEEGRLKEALRRGVRANSYPYVCLGQGCMNAKALAEGKQTQARSSSSSMETGLKSSCRCLGFYRIHKSHHSSRSMLTTVPFLAAYAFAEPSVTAGEVEDYGKHLTDQEVVLEYLRSEGIDSSELEGVDLPTSLEVVRERVEFLTKIGLTVSDINDYPLMVGCSVKKNLIPVLNYLESLKITTNSLPILIRKYPRILHASVVVDLEPIVTYLQGLGIQLKQLGSVLTRYPDVFGFNIEGTMSTSIAYLVMIGVNPREIGGILTEKPEILGMRVGNNIKPKVDYLISFGIPRPVISKMIEKQPFILGLGLADQMRPTVDSLLEIGVKREAIAHFLVQFPEVLGLDVKVKLAEKLPWLTSIVGIREDSMGQILEKLPQILVINVPLGTARVDFLRQAGFSAEDVGQMVTACPQLLALSIDQMLKPSLDFLVEEMKRNVKDVVEFPMYFTYSLDNRIRPRYEQITEKGVKCSLAWMLKCNDTKFQERLEVGTQETQIDVLIPVLSFSDKS